MCLDVPGIEWSAVGISEREKKYDNDIWVEEAWIGEESKQVNKKTIKDNSLSILTI